MINFDFDSIKDMLKKKWNLLILIVFIKAIVLLVYLLVDFQFFLQYAISFADHLYYTEFGVAISNGYFPSNQKTIGLPIIMAPFFSLFKPSYAGPLYEPTKFILYLYFLDFYRNYAIAYILAYIIPLIPVSQSIVLPWAIFNGVILGSIAPLTLYKIVNNIFENEELALISAVIFCLYPFIFIFSYPKFIHMIGFLELSDLTSLVFILFSFYYFIKVEKSDKIEGSSYYLSYILLAFFTSFAILIRISNVLIIIIFVVIVLFSEKFIEYLNDFRQENNIIISFIKSFYGALKERKRYLISILIIGVMISFQLIYNQIHFGSFLTFGYTWYYDHFYRFQWVLPEFQELGFVGIDYAILTPNGYISSTYFMNSIIAILSGYSIEFIIGTVGAIILLVKKPKTLPILISWILSFMIFYSFQGFTQLESVAVRFLMPMIPAFCILIGVVVITIIHQNFE